MRLSIERESIKVYPDMKRVIARYFFYGEERARQVIGRVMGLSEAAVLDTISPILQEYSKCRRYDAAFRAEALRLAAARALSIDPKRL